MIDASKRLEREQEKERTRRRMRVEIDPDKYEFIPEERPVGYYDDDVEQRVAIYVRVSTDDVRQTTSFELQKIYYEDFVKKHPMWHLVKIYADEGISGTSTKKREAFLSMIADAKAKKIDLIITKSVSRFARNAHDFLGVINELADMTPPVGVFFESEAIFSLNDDSQLALTFQSAMAQEESHTRSRSMESSLRMRLDNGIPLTPKLLGYTHNADGELIINPEEAKTVKLAFFMYLYGYSTQQIADAFIALEKASYLGNTTKWTSNAIVQILRNERHCGDVLTRKTYTINFREHKKAKNRRNRPQSHYIDHHEAIISRDDFIAVQHLLDNSRYRNKSLIPELRVIDDGFLKGYVIINPRWAAFKEDQYLTASRSVYQPGEDPTPTDTVQVEVKAGDFDMRGFEVVRSEFFETKETPFVTFDHKKIHFNTSCVRRFDKKNWVELLINPINRRFAIRPVNKENRNAVMISKTQVGKFHPVHIATAAFSETVYSLLGWNTDYRYRVTGSFVEQDGEIACLFDMNDSQAFLSPYAIPSQEVDEDGQPLSRPFQMNGKRVRAVPESWTSSFGKTFYYHEQTYEELEGQSEEAWKLRLEGQVALSGHNCKITEFSTIKSFIQRELRGVNLGEIKNERTFESVVCN